MIDYIRKINADLNALSVRIPDQKLKNLATSAAVIGQLTDSNQLVLPNDKKAILTLIARVSHRLVDIDIHFEVPASIIYLIQMQIDDNLSHKSLHFVYSDLDILRQLDHSRKDEFILLLGVWIIFFL